jgi:hypothetical protein
MGSTSKAEIMLIPWDPESPEHIQRLYQQRVACGWYEDLDLIESWRPRQRSGAIALQWKEDCLFAPKRFYLSYAKNLILYLQVLGDSDPAKEAKLNAHANKAWPLEAKPIVGEVRWRGLADYVLKPFLDLILRQGSHGVLLYCRGSGRHFRRAYSTCT